MIRVTIRIYFFHSYFLSRLREVNRDLFNSQTVVRRQGNSLVINTDMLNMTAQYVQYQNIVVASANPVSEVRSIEVQSPIVVVPVDSAASLSRSESNVPVATATEVKWIQGHSSYLKIVFHLNVTLCYFWRLNNWQLIMDWLNFVFKNFVLD